LALQQVRQLERRFRKNAKIVMFQIMLPNCHFSPTQLDSKRKGTQIYKKTMFSLELTSLYCPLVKMFIKLY